MNSRVDARVDVVARTNERTDGRILGLPISRHAQAGATKIKTTNAMFSRLGKTLCDKTTQRTDSKKQFVQHYEVVSRCYPGSVIKSVPITIFCARVMISKMKTTNAIFSKLGKSPCDKTTHRTESKINLCNTTRP